MNKKFVQQLADDVRVLKETFHRRKIDLPNDSLLATYLAEAENFINETNKKTPSTSVRALENEKAQCADQILMIYRIASSYRLLKKSHQLTKNLHEIAIKNTTIQQKEQFRDNEYEIYSASQFVQCDRRVNFIRDSGTISSRYKKRVEFLVNNRFPVECKRPQKLSNVVGLIDEASVKIAERNDEYYGEKMVAPGLICISLDVAMRSNSSFDELENVQGFVDALKKK